MPNPSFQAIIGNALIDTDFRHDLLNGSRRRILQSFDFTNEEVEAIMTIRAESLEQFAGALHQYLLASQGQREIDPPIKHLRWRVRPSSQSN